MQSLLRNFADGIWTVKSTSSPEVENISRNKRGHFFALVYMTSPTALARFFWQTESASRTLEESCQKWRNFLSNLIEFIS